MKWIFIDLILRFREDFDILWVCFNLIEWIIKLLDLTIRCYVLQSASSSNTRELSIECNIVCVVFSILSSINCVRGLFRIFNREAVTHASWRVAASDPSTAWSGVTSLPLIRSFLIVHGRCKVNQISLFTPNTLMWDMVMFTSRIRALYPAPHYAAFKDTWPRCIQERDCIRRMSQLSYTETI